MLQHEKPLLTALYLNKIGHKQYKSFCLSIELQRLKFRLSLLQAYANRNERPDLKAVDKKVETTFEEYNRQIEAEAERLAAAKRFLSGNFLTSENSKKLRELYYFIVKRLHPDINADLSDNMKDLFIQAQAAYDLGDLEILQQIALLLKYDSAETVKLTPELLAIGIYHNGICIGWVPQEINEMISRLMDAGKAFFCRITSAKRKNKWLKVYKILKNNTSFQNVFASLRNLVSTS